MTTVITGTLQCDAIDSPLYNHGYTYTSWSNNDETFSALKLRIGTTYAGSGSLTADRVKTIPEKEDIKTQFPGWQDGDTFNFYISNGSAKTLTLATSGTDTVVKVGNTDFTVPTMTSAAFRFTIKGGVNSTTVMRMS